MATVLELILQQSQKAQQSTADVQSAAKETFRGQEIVQGQITDIYSKVGESAAIVARQAQEANIAVQNAKVQAATAAGLSPDAASGRLIDLLARQKVAGEQVLTTLDEVNRKRNRSIFDIVSDPVGTVKDIFTLYDSEQELKQQVEGTQIIGGQIINTNNALQETFQTQEALKVVSTAATADAAAQIAAAEAQILAKRSQMEGLKYNLLGIQAIQAADVQTLELLGKSANAIQAEQTMRMQNANLAINLRQLKMQEEKFAMEKAAKKEGIDFDAYLASNIAVSMKSLGLAVPEGMGMKQVVAMFKGGDQSFMYHARNGQRISATGGTTAYIGASPDEAVDVIGKFDLNVPAQMKPTLDVLTRALADPALARVDKKKEPDRWASEYNKTVGAIVNQDFASVVPGSGNPFDVGALDTYIQNPTIAALGVTQKLLQPMVASGVATSDPRVVLKAGAAAVAAGTITSTEFSQLGVIYQQASLIHQKAIGLDRVGIVPPMAGRQYNVKMGGFVDGTVNLTDNTELARWLARNMSQAVMIDKGTKAQEQAAKEFTAPIKRFFSDSYSNTIKKYQGQP